MGSCVFLRPKLFIILMLFVAFLPGPSARAYTLGIKDIVLIDEEENLNFYFNLNGVSTEDIKSNISKGIQIEFHYIIRFYRINEVWFNKKMADDSIGRSIKFNPMTKMYTVFFPFENKISQDFSSLENAIKSICEVKAFGVYKTKKLEKGAQYRIRFKAIVKNNTKQSLFTGSLILPGNQETDWYSIEFIY